MLTSTVYFKPLLNAVIITVLFTQKKFYCEEMIYLMYHILFPDCLSLLICIGV